MTCRVQTGLSFIENYLNSQLNRDGPDLAWLRSIYIVLSFHFEILLKARLIDVTHFKNLNEIDLILKKVGHDILAITRKLGDEELKKINIYNVSLKDAEYIIATDKFTIFINNFTDIRYDFIEGKVRNVKNDENDKIRNSVNGTHSILNQVILLNKENQ